MKANITNIAIYTHPTYVYIRACLHTHLTHTHTLLAGEGSIGQISAESATLFCDSSLATMEGLSHREVLFSVIKTGKMLYTVTETPSQSSQVRVDFGMVGCF